MYPVDWNRKDIPSGRPVCVKWWSFIGIWPEEVEQVKGRLKGQL
jgi:hypothetical protein